MPNLLDRGCLVWGFLCLLLALFGSTSGPAQQPGERTFEEVKDEAIKRAENGMYPLIGLDPADVREAFSSLTSMNNDEWAASFSRVADRYMAEAKEGLASLFVRTLARPGVAREEGGLCEGP